MLQKSENVQKGDDFWGSFRGHHSTCLLLKITK